MLGGCPQLHARSLLPSSHARLKRVITHEPPARPPLLQNSTHEVNQDKLKKEVRK